MGKQNDSLARGVASSRRRSTKCSWTRTGSDFPLKEQPDTLSLFHCFASFLIDPKQEPSQSFYRVTRVVAHRGGTLQEAERKTASGAEKTKRKKEGKLNRKKFSVCSEQNMSAKLCDTQALLIAMPLLGSGGQFAVIVSFHACFWLKPARETLRSCALNFPLLQRRHEAAADATRRRISRTRPLHSDVQTKAASLASVIRLLRLYRPSF